MDPHSNMDTKRLEKTYASSLEIDRKRAAESAAEEQKMSKRAARAAKARAKAEAKAKVEAEQAASKQHLKDMLLHTPSHSSIEPLASTAGVTDKPIATPADPSAIAAARQATMMQVFENERERNAPASASPGQSLYVELNGITYFGVVPTAAEPGQPITIVLKPPARRVMQQCD